MSYSQLTDFSVLNNCFQQALQIKDQLSLTRWKGQFIHLKRSHVNELHQLIDINEIHRMKTVQSCVQKMWEIKRDCGTYNEVVAAFDELYSKPENQSEKQIMQIEKCMQSVSNSVWNGFKRLTKDIVLSLIMLQSYQYIPQQLTDEYFDDSTVFHVICFKCEKCLIKSKSWWSICWPLLYNCLTPDAQQFFLYSYESAQDALSTLFYSIANQAIKDQITLMAQNPINLWCKKPIALRNNQNTCAIASLVNYFLSIPSHCAALCDYARRANIRGNDETTTMTTMQLWSELALYATNSSNPRPGRLAKLCTSLYDQLKIQIGDFQNPNNLLFKIESEINKEKELPVQYKLALIQRRHIHVTHENKCDQGHLKRTYDTNENFLTLNSPFGCKLVHVWFGTENWWTQIPEYQIQYHESPSPNVSSPYYAVKTEAIFEYFGLNEHPTMKSDEYYACLMNTKKIISIVKIPQKHNSSSMLYLAFETGTGGIAAETHRNQTLQQLLDHLHSVFNWINKDDIKLITTGGSIITNASLAQKVNQNNSTVTGFTFTNNAIKGWCDIFTHCKLEPLRNIPEMETYLETHLPSQTSNVEVSSGCNACHTRDLTTNDYKNTVTQTCHNIPRNLFFMIKRPEYDSALLFNVPPSLTIMGKRYDLESTIVWQNWASHFTSCIRISGSTYIAIDDDKCINVNQLDSVGIGYLYAACAKLLLRENFNHVKRNYFSMNNDDNNSSNNELKPQSKKRLRGQPNIIEIKDDSDNDMFNSKGLFNENNINNNNNDNSIDYEYWDKNIMNKNDINNNNNDIDIISNTTPTPYLNTNVPKHYYKEEELQLLSELAKNDLQLPLVQADILCKCLDVYQQMCYWISKYFREENIKITIPMISCCVGNVEIDQLLYQSFTIVLLQKHSTDMNLAIIDFIQNKFIPNWNTKASIVSNNPNKNDSSNDNNHNLDLTSNIRYGRNEIGQLFQQAVNGRVIDLKFGLKRHKLPIIRSIDMIKSKEFLFVIFGIICSFNPHFYNLEAAKLNAHYKKMLACKMQIMIALFQWKISKKDDIQTCWNIIENVSYLLGDHHLTNPTGISRKSSHWTSGAIITLFQNFDKIYDILNNLTSKRQHIHPMTTKDKNKIAFYISMFAAKRDLKMNDYKDIEDKTESLCFLDGRFTPNLRPNDRKQLQSFDKWKQKLNTFQTTRINKTLVSKQTLNACNQACNILINVKEFERTLVSLIKNEPKISLKTYLKCRAIFRTEVNLLLSENEILDNDNMDTMSTFSGITSYIQFPGTVVGSAGGIVNMDNENGMNLSDDDMDQDNDHESNVSFALLDFKGQTRTCKDIWHMFIALNYIMNGHWNFKCDEDNSIIDDMNDLQHAQRFVFNKLLLSINGPLAKNLSMETNSLFNYKSLSTSMNQCKQNLLKYVITAPMLLLSQTNALNEVAAEYNSKLRELWRENSQTAVTQFLQDLSLRIRTNCDNMTQFKAKTISTKEALNVLVEYFGVEDINSWLHVIIQMVNLICFEQEFNLKPGEKFCLLDELLTNEQIVDQHFGPTLIKTPLMPTKDQANSLKTNITNMKNNMAANNGKKSQSNTFEHRRNERQILLQILSDFRDDPDNPYCSDIKQVMNLCTDLPNASALLNHFGNVAQRHMFKNLTNIQNQQLTTNTPTSMTSSTTFLGGNAKIINCNTNNINPTTSIQETKHVQALNTIISQFIQYIKKIDEQFYKTNLKPFTNAGTMAKNFRLLENQLKCNDTATSELQTKKMLELKDWKNFAMIIERHIANVHGKDYLFQFARRLLKLWFAYHPHLFETANSSIIAFSNKKVFDLQSTNACVKELKQIIKSLKKSNKQPTPIPPVPNESFQRINIPKPPPPPHNSIHVPQSPSSHNSNNTNNNSINDPQSPSSQNSNNTNNNSTNASQSPSSQNSNNTNNNSTNVPQSPSSQNSNNTNNNSINVSQSPSPQTKSNTNSNTSNKSPQTKSNNSNKTPPPNESINNQHGTTQVTLTPLTPLTYQSEKPQTLQDIFNIFNTKLQNADEKTRYMTALTLISPSASSAVPSKENLETNKQLYEALQQFDKLCENFAITNEKEAENRKQMDSTKWANIYNVACKIYSLHQPYLKVIRNNQCVLPKLVTARYLIHTEIKQNNSKKNPTNTASTTKQTQ